MVRVGSATSDVLRGKAGDKLVEITVRLPKSLRKQLKAEAKARGTTVDDLVAHCLAQKLLR